MKKLLKFGFLIGIVLISYSIQAHVILPRLVSDGMVLQRKTAVQIWGWASPGEHVTISFLDSTYSTVAAKDSSWSIHIAPQSAGGPYTMKIKGSNTITLKNILIGDVWVCSGQSNMEISLKRVEPLYPHEIANSENKNIHYFDVPKAYNFKGPQEHLKGGNWEYVNPKMAPGMSAVAYFFAKELYKKYKVPIGLVHSSLGGSPIEAWESASVLKKFPATYAVALKYQSDSLIKAIQHSDWARSSKWYHESSAKDAGYKNPKMPWTSPKLDDSSWPEMQIPGYWSDEETGPINGVIWFRREINIPGSMAGKQAKLNVGRIIDADSVFVNGKFVGRTTYQYPPRRYIIPAGVLKAGRNSIVVRVISNIYRGGFVPDKPYDIVEGNQKVDLRGTWKYHVGVIMPPLQPQTFIRFQPEGLYNAMIAPLLNYKIKGVVWYQGESNTLHPMEYYKLFPAMINDWRSKWGEGDFPFLYVQLPNFMLDRQNDWPDLRQAQLNTLKVKNTGMAITIDIGEWNDIHPLDKEDVGKRLSLLARKIAYGENITASGPIYKSMKIDGNKIILSFTSVGDGLTVKGGGDLKQFTISGDDIKFVKAHAKIQGDKVIVWSDSVKKPVAVHYAWANNPVGANLYNKEGLPASPFGTDKSDECN